MFSTRNILHGLVLFLLSFSLIRETVGSTSVYRTAPCVATLVTLRTAQKNGEYLDGESINSLRTHLGSWIQRINPQPSYLKRPYFVQRINPNLKTLELIRDRLVSDPFKGDKDVYMGVFRNTAEIVRFARDIETFTMELHNGAAAVNTNRFKTLSAGIGIAAHAWLGAWSIGAFLNHNILAGLIPMLFMVPNEAVMTSMNLYFNAAERNSKFLPAIRLLGRYAEEGAAPAEAVWYYAEDIWLSRNLKHQIEEGSGETLAVEHAKEVDARVPLHLDFVMPGPRGERVRQLHSKRKLFSFNLLSIPAKSKIYGQENDEPMLFVVVTVTR